MTIILCIRTDKPEAELHLYKDNVCVEVLTWQAHRQLAETIHSKIDELLAESGIALADIGAIVYFKGPGSFTGLRIGASVAATLAYSLEKGIVYSSGDDWISGGVNRVLDRDFDESVDLEYGQPVRITQQKK
jgi:tRNA threonylcarbamoyladenosine biosynthesis protein TsaB